MSKRFCQDCGTEIPEGSDYCPNCGTLVAIQQTVIVTKPKKKKVKMPKAFYFVILLYVLTVAYFIEGVILINTGDGSAKELSLTNIYGLAALEVCMIAGVGHFVIVLVKTIKDSKGGNKPSVMFIIAASMVLAGALLSQLLMISSNIVVSPFFFVYALPFEIISLVNWRKNVTKEKENEE